MGEKNGASRRFVLKQGAVFTVGGTLAQSGIAFAATPARPGTAPPAGELLDRGISEKLARHRAAALSKVAYHIKLDLTQTDRTAGSVEISFDRKPRSGDVIFDFRGLELNNLRVNGRPVQDLRSENGHFVVPERHFTRGRNEIAADFTSRIAKSGAAIIRYDDTTDGSRYLYTLFVPWDANLLFPCFDQPDLKGRITWDLTAPSGWTVLANSPVARRTSTGEVTRWEFEPTPPIPLYVSSFAAGPWQAWRSDEPGKRPITLYARKSRAGEVDVEPLIKSNRDTLHWLETWLSTPYPFAKYDMVIAPAFPLGAMEDVASIRYNESATLFREPPSLSQKLNREQVIYHEISHQWFGNFVTMKWFDDLWLKEGFSTFVAAYLQDSLQPESGAWKTFYIRLKPQAYNLEVTRATTPLWQALPNLAEAGGNYGAIVYNKAPAVLKQLLFLIGETSFRKGLRSFLARHAYANATWRDLLAAMEAFSGVSLERFGRQYFLRRGMPRVDTELSLRGGRIAELALTQKSVISEGDGSGDTWPMKLSVRLGYASGEDVILPVRLDGPRAVVEGAEGRPAPDYVWANDGDHGYGLFQLDTRSAAWVRKNLGSIGDPLLRVLLWGAIWEEVREARMAPREFIDLAIHELRRESDEQIARFVMFRASTALNFYLPDRQVAEAARSWDRFLADQTEAAQLSYGLRKEYLDALTNDATSPEALDVLRAFLSGKRLFDGAKIRPTVRWNIVTRLLALDTIDAKALFEAERSGDTSPDADRQAFLAGATSADPARKEEYFRRYVEDKSLNEAWAYQSFANFNDPAQAEVTIHFLERALGRLAWAKENRTIAFLPMWIRGFVGQRRDERSLEIIDRFRAVNSAIPADIRRPLLEARDDLARTVKIRTMAAKR